MANFKLVHEKDENSDHNDDEKERGRKEFEESFEETKESTPKNANSIQKSQSHDNLHAHEQHLKKMEESSKEKAIGKSAEVQIF